ncbi:CAP domain-containing protein [Auriculariales sp. MPI-PUGE-AT-0066]|nr:CAP domain-containing protein [Auriculariales sp. MPI-PUGE-AT-0066]
MTSDVDEPTYHDFEAREHDWDSFADEDELELDDEEVEDFSDLTDEHEHSLETRAASKKTIKAWLTAHNNERKRHGAKALVWNATLANAATKWTNTCTWGHSGGKVGPYGENLATAVPASSGGPKKSVDMWNNERKDYNPKSPNYSHWTQVVWKGTRQVGCAARSCGKLKSDPFGTSYKGTRGIWACEYYPPGNVIGQFGKNVQK